MEEMQGGAYISEEMWIVEGLFLICLLTGMLVSEADTFLNRGWTPLNSLRIQCILRV